MEKSTEVPAFATMPKPTPTSSLLVLNKDTPSSVREETTNLKSNGDSEKKLASTLDPSMVLQETLNKRNTFCQLQTGLPKFGPKNSKSPSCRPVTTILT